MLGYHLVPNVFLFATFSNKSKNGVFACLSRCSYASANSIMIGGNLSGAKLLQPGKCKFGIGSKRDKEGNILEECSRHRPNWAGERERGTTNQFRLSMRYHRVTLRNHFGSVCYPSLFLPLLQSSGPCMDDEKKTASNLFLYFLIL